MFSRLRSRVRSPVVPKCPFHHDFIDISFWTQVMRRHISDSTLSIYTIVKHLAVYTVAGSSAGKGYTGSRNVFLELKLELDCPPGTVTCCLCSEERKFSLATHF